MSNLNFPFFLRLICHKFVFNCICRKAMAVGAAFPLAKLGFLLIKQVSKPIAKSIAQRAKNSPFFKNWICIPVAQAFHFYEVKVKMTALNLGSGRVTKVPKLSETQAVQQGAELLSEIIILSIASGKK